MCFTVNVNIVKEELERRYGTNLIDHENYRPSYYYHAFSFPRLPVVTRRPDGDNQLSLFSWGLIPGWTASADDASRIREMTLNARSETLLEKPAFAESFSRRRCLLPVEGFFEWKHEAGKKIPYYIYIPGNPVISLAAIYDRWQGETGDPIYSFSIVTTSANSLMAEIHNRRKRMPVIVNRDDEDEWLYQGTDRERLDKIMKSYPDNILAAHTISPLIGNSRLNRNTPEIIRPYSYPGDLTLF